MRSRVLLPLPLAPRMLSVSPVETSKLMPFTRACPGRQSANFALLSNFPASKAPLGAAQHDDKHWDAKERGDDTDGDLKGKDEPREAVAKE